MFVTSAIGVGGAMPTAHPLRVVIAGGGTGGHLFPGIAVARELVSRTASDQISFVGTSRGIETRAVPRAGFALDTIRVVGIKGKSISASVRAAALLPVSLADAWRVVSRRRPDLVIGVGGYSAGPVVLIAALRGIPTLLLEQNAVPGLTNRLLAPFVRAAAVSFESTRAFFGTKAFLSGNPVRPEFLAAAGAGPIRGDAEPAMQLLVFGGSQGAHAINMAMIEAASELQVRLPGVRVTHQTGEADLAAVRRAYEKVGLGAEVEPFFDDLAGRLARSDVLVCRAGATTLAEITAAGKAAILIPLPTATDDHQRINAEALAAAGAAEVLLQSELSGRTLAGRIIGLARDDGGRARMSAAAHAMGRPGAAAAIVDRALALVGDP